MLLTGDKAIARRPIEARSVVAASARVFVLGTNQLAGPSKAERLLRHETAIFKRAAASNGPCVVSVTEQGLMTLTLARPKADPR